jgi:cytoskeletal protein CcmA (bactofilin family)
MEDKIARRSSSGEASTFGRGVGIKGRVTGDGDVTIEGTVDGELSIGGALHVAGEARVHAKVEAASVLVEGVLEGDITSSGPVKAGTGAKLKGTIVADAFSMDDGAEVSAQVVAEFDLPPELTGRAG